MVWCAYCGQEFARADHLDSHVLTHTNPEPFECSICRLSFQRRDLLQRHYQSEHQDQDEAALDVDTNDFQPRNIACTACAKAKAKCNRVLPCCRRCEAKGITCEPRSSKRSNDAAFRQSRQQQHLGRRPINIAPYPDTSSQALSPGFNYHSDSTQWATPPHGQYAFTTPYDGFNSSSSYPGAAGYQAAPQNYPLRSPYLVGAFASGESPHTPQVAQIPATSVGRYYTQTAGPSVAPSPLGWASTYSVTDTAAYFTASSGSHQNANLDQANHYALPEAYAYGRDMLPSTTRASTSRDTFGEFGFGTTGTQADFMTTYSDPMPDESSEYYHPE